MTSSTSRWAEKSCLITGGSSGIGLAMAKQLAAEGAHIWLLARNSDRLEAAVQSLQAVRRSETQRFGAISADVTQPEQVSAAIQALVDDIGAPNVLINSAGIIHPGRVEELDLEVYRWTMDLNVMGTIYVTKAVLPGMLQRKSGHIINISSVAGFLSIFGYTAYSASKFAIRGFSDALRAELKPKGIRVSLALPPDTDTPGLDYELPKRPPELSAIAGLSKALPADKVAADLLKQAAQGKYLLLPGFDTRVMWALAHILAGGVHPLMDYLVADAQKKQAAKK